MDLGGADARICERTMPALRDATKRRFLGVSIAMMATLAGREEACMARIIGQFVDARGSSQQLYQLETIDSFLGGNIRHYAYLTLVESSQWVIEGHFISCSWEKKKRTGGVLPSVSRALLVTADAGIGKAVSCVSSQSVAVLHRQLP